MIIPRNLYTKRIHTGFKNNPIVILTGARQVGKTTLMNSFPYNDRAYFMHGQKPEVADLFGNYSALCRHLEINLDKNLCGLLRIDEFQYLPEVSTVLKLLADEYTNLKILCTGSSSLDIVQKVEESLAGRIRVIPVYSLSFSEYLSFCDPDLYRLYEQYGPNDNVRVFDKKILHLFMEYLLYGGLPKVALEANYNEKTMLLDDIYQTYLLHDVRNYVRNQDTVGFNKLLRLLSAHIGAEVNINELSQNTRMTYNKCEEYLSLLEQMYIIKLLEPYTTNKRKEVTRMKKVYLYDTGMRNLIYNSFNDLEVRIDKGAIFENFVFLELSRYLNKPVNINFYRTKDGLEVDFIINTTKQIIPVEVKFRSFQKAENIRTLTQFYSIQEFSNALLVNKDFNYNNGNIRFISGMIFSKVLQGLE
ncbi:MAG: ATP-binding protein [Bacteroidia bacterium]|nr:ATP-binding protein [Bacteroidia bacterium]